MPSCPLNKKAHEENLLRRRLSSIRHRILIMSNKGGVGKSTVTANLGASLARKGLQTGIADADIHGPNIPKMFGADSHRVKISDRGIAPFAYSGNLKIASIGFMLGHPDDPVIWRDAFKWEFLHQLLSSFDWAELDVLLIDLPPGTGNESITLIDLIRPLSGVVIVTSPQQVALLDVRKAISFCRSRNVPILGIVENMAGITCPNCRNDIQVFPEGEVEKTAQELGLKVLVRIPIFPRIAFEADQGRPIVDANSCAEEASPFHVLAERCWDQLNQES
jgi:Mrp family chromosome partitioning ATPase